MVSVGALSVGTVAGLIAAGVFVVQRLIPIIFPLILVGFLGNENSAATWSVAGRVLHSSHWPMLLKSDSAGVHGVRSSVRSLAICEVLVLLLVAAASIVTPLGLYDTIVPQKNLQDETFSYAADNSSMGLGTLPRLDSFGLSRSCGGGFRPVQCPWSDTVIIETVNETTYTADLPDGYDIRIPKNITDIYSAGLSNLGKTVSSVFDIQWRTYKKVLKTGLMKEGQQYLVGEYRQLTSMILNDAWEAITGLIVDTKSGGIGFRNHTIPPVLPFGSTWSEDLLFIEPETECVDLNITLDFNIAYSNDVMDNVENLTVTDRGGFANFDREIPWYDRNKTWENASLRDRAYFAAWFSNVYSMFYLNVTNPKNKVFSQRFQYVNSTIGTKYPVASDSIGAFKARYDRLMIEGDYGSFLNIPDLSLNTSLRRSSYSNPFNISSLNFTDIASACSDNDGSYYANISNIAVSCGMIYGAARRKDGSASLMFDPGSEWTIPLYSCASASKASIKTVSFRYNGTQGLQSLDVVDIKPKTYANADEMPLWAVENLKMQLSYLNPVWGITLPEHDGHPNISTARQEHLYLPGFGDPIFASSPANGGQNLAGVDFYSRIMTLSYNLEDATTYGIPDYTGKSNLAMYNKWQEYSRTTETAAKIMNLIWTDISANAVVGVKSQLGSPPLQNLAKRAEPQASVKVPITVYTRRVRFHIIYGIPAFIVLGLCAILAAVALGFMLMGRAGPSTVRENLDRTSAGRTLATFLYTNDCSPRAKRADWARLVGWKNIDLAGTYPRATDSTSGTPLSTNHGVSPYPPGTATSAPYGKFEEAAISLQSLQSPQPYSPVNGTDNGPAYNHHGSAHQYTYIPQPVSRGR